MRLGEGYCGTLARVQALRGRSVGRSWKWRREEEDANGAWCRKPWESAPVSTTASAWHHQQHPTLIFPNNKETKKQHALSFLPSFVFTHFLLFPRPARRSSSPRVREREIRDTTEESADTENKLLHRHRKRSTNHFSLCVQHPATTTTTTRNHKC